VQFEEVAKDVFRMALLPFDVVNVYIADGVVIDSGLRMTQRILFHRLEGRRVTAHLLTHAHPDHQGSSAALCRKLQIPFWCARADRPAAESGTFHSVVPGSGAFVAWIAGLLGGPGQKVAREVAEGDRVGNFEVIETPGHTPGHVSLWREMDGVLILGDVAFHRNPVTLTSGLQEPFRIATFDPEMNRRSARKVASLRPNVICFGHGEPLRDGDKFTEWVRNLPDR